MIKHLSIRYVKKKYARFTTTSMATVLLVK